MSRLLETLRSLIRETLPAYDYLGPRRYRVVRMVAERAELQIVRRVSGLPDLLPISQVPGIPGLSAALTPGAEVLVQFVDGDPSQPVITHYASAKVPGWIPVSLALEATQRIDIDAPTVTVGQLPAARRGDLVTSGSKTVPTACQIVLAVPLVGAVAGATATISAGTPIIGAITFPTLLPGQIATGRG